MPALILGGDLLPIAHQWDPNAAPKQMRHPER
jgi:hypothetical protein